MTEEEYRIVRVDRCRLKAVPGIWAFAVDHRDAILAHWHRRRRDNPGFFNGTIYALCDFELKDGVFDGRLLAVDFMSFLYWKDSGYRDGAIRDCFGSALIRSADGHVLLGRQRAGNLNAGLSYLPGGFIDLRDADDSGVVGIAASVAREAAEETGLGADVLTRRPGYILTFAGPMVSIAVEFVSSLTSDDLLARVRDHISSDPGSELEDAVLVARLQDLEGLSVPLYAKALIPRVLSGL